MAYYISPFSASSKSLVNAPLKKSADSQRSSLCTTNFLRLSPTKRVTNSSPRLLRYHQYDSIVLTGTGTMLTAQVVSLLSAAQRLVIELEMPLSRLLKVDLARVSCLRVAKWLVDGGRSCVVWKEGLGLQVFNLRGVGYSLGKEICQNQSWIFRRFISQKSTSCYLILNRPGGHRYSGSAAKNQKKLQ
jgi:hypothetical protein